MKTESFLANIGDTVNTTEISPLRGPFVVLGVWAEGGFCRYDVAFEKGGAKVSTLRNKDIMKKTKQTAVNNKFLALVKEKLNEKFFRSVSKIVNKYGEDMARKYLESNGINLIE